MIFIDNDYMGALILLILFVLIIVITEFLTRKFKPPTEISRKAVHIFGGLGCLLFPFLIKSPLIVCALALIFSLIFFFGQKNKRLICLSGVERKSRGSEYYPIAISFIFFVARDQLWLYFTSVLILTVSDAAAALIGKKFGKIKYTVLNDEKKSLEGSLVFFLITWSVTTILLSSLTTIILLKCVLCGFLVAVLLTGTEAVSIGGTDNIFVPVLTCYILLKITTKSVDEVAFQCIIMTALFIFLQTIIHYVKIFSIRDSIIFVLFSYAAWSLGSMLWCLPIIIAFLIYAVIRLRNLDTEEQYEIDTKGLLQTIMIPLCILLVANTLKDWETYYGPYLVAAIMSFVFGAWHYFLCTDLRKSTKRIYKGILLALVSASLMAFVANSIGGQFYCREILFIIIMCILGIIIYDIFLKKIYRTELPEFRARPMWLLTFCVSAVYYFLQEKEILAIWI